MNEPNFAADYGAREVRAMHAVLVELGQILGTWRGKFVIVGGAVPWLLLGHARPAHIGTLDIDLGLDPEALGDGEYANLVEALERKGYERNRPGLRPFQLRRWVPLDPGAPVSVIVDLLMPRDARGDRNARKLVEGLRVQGADGVEVALSHRVTQRLEGMMPDGRLNGVDLPVAALPALLVMKGYALANREKKKDPYDVYFSARNYNGGPEALAAEVRQASRRSRRTSGLRAAGRQVSLRTRLRSAFGPTVFGRVGSFGRDDTRAGADGRF